MSESLSFKVALLGFAITTAAMAAIAVEPFAIAECKEIAVGNGSADTQVFFGEQIPACIEAAEIEDSSQEIVAAKKYAEDLKGVSVFSADLILAREKAEGKAREITAQTDPSLNFFRVAGLGGLFLVAGGLICFARAPLGS